MPRAQRCYTCKLCKVERFPTQCAISGSAAAAAAAQVRDAEPWVLSDPLNQDLDSDLISEGSFAHCSDRSVAVKNDDGKGGQGGLGGRPYGRPGS